MRQRLFFGMHPCDFVVAAGTRPASETSCVAVFKFRCLRPAGAIPALGGHFPIIVKLKDHDVRVLISGWAAVVPSSRHIPILVQATTNLHDLQRTVLLAPLLE